MAEGSTILILYDGGDISNKAIVSSANFEMLSNAQPGSFQFTVKDPTRTLSFQTGKSIELRVDGVTMWGGYLTTVSPTYAFPAVDTTDISKVSAREFVLRGVDYNILLDKLVVRNVSNYLQHPPNFSKDQYDGDLIKNVLFPTLIDTPAGFDTSSKVSNVTKPFDPLNEGLSGEGAWVQQGSKLREAIQDFAQFSGAVYYFSGDKKFWYHSIETSHATWGFSDHPNKIPVSVPAIPGKSTYGFRDLDATEDGSIIVNDALVWGGSEWAGAGNTLFAREENTASIATYGRWQRAELHFGEDGFGVQSGVDARADVIVNGAPGAVGGDPFRGLRFAQWTIRLTWFGHDVPSHSGTKQHLKAGDLVTIILYSFGTDVNHPLIRTLPLRSLRMTFPSLDKTGKAYIRFEGTFSLQLGDPYNIWRYLTDPKRLGAITTAVSSTPPGQDTTSYGAYFSSALTPSPNGSTTVFDLPNDFGYIAGTTTIYLNGLFQRRGIEYNETNPGNGTITMTSPPQSGDELWVICRTT